MTRVFISLGSNIEPEHNLPEAIRLLAEHCSLVAISPIYETAPVGTTEQANFLNAAVLLETELSAQRLKREVLQPIEQQLKRVRTADKNAPRTIDLDITLFGNQVLELGTRHLPDPELLRYPHIAQPLADLAPQLRHPETGQTLAEIAQSLPTKGLHRRTELSDLLTDEH